MQSTALNRLFKFFTKWHLLHLLKFFLLIFSDLTTICKNFLKNLLKKFANQKNCRTFVPGLRKRGSLSGINLLVISFSVINYVVSKSVRLRQADTLFFIIFAP